MLPFRLEKQRNPRRPAIASTGTSMVATVASNLAALPVRPAQQSPPPASASYAPAAPPQFRPPLRAPSLQSRSAPSRQTAPPVPLGSHPAQYSLRVCQVGLRHPAAAWSRQTPAPASAPGTCATTPAAHSRQWSSLQTPLPAIQDDQGEPEYRLASCAMVSTGASGTRANPPTGKFLPNPKLPCPRKSGTMARTPARSSFSGRQKSDRAGWDAETQPACPAPLSRKLSLAPSDRRIRSFARHSGQTRADTPRQPVWFLRNPDPARPDRPRPQSRW